MVIEPSRASRWWRPGACVFAALIGGMVSAPAVQAQAPGAGAACPPQFQAPSAEQVQAAAQSARDHGALWKVMRDGRTSYLFGTLHVGKLEWALPGPKVGAALAATDTLALELDPTDPQMLERMARPVSGAAPVSVPPKERIARRLDRACVPASLRPVLDAQHPMLQAMTLVMLEARWEGLDMGYAQEVVLAGMAHAAQRPIVSLETPELQLAALMPADGAEMNQAIESLLEQIERGTGRRTLARLAAAWTRGDLDDIAAYERWCNCVLDAADRRALTRLLDDRNPGLADSIATLHRDGTRVFAAVGALHMVGPNGLPQLLRQRGFAVERVSY